MSKRNLSDMRGCIHTESSQTRVCRNCWASLCWDCCLEARVGVKGYKGMGAVIEYTQLCPACYIEWRAKTGKLIKGKLTFFSTPSAMLSSHDYGAFFLMIIMILFCGLGFLLWLGSYTDYKEEYNRQQKAYKMLEERVSLS